MSANQLFRYFYIVTSTLFANPKITRTGKPDLSAVDRIERYDTIADVHLFGESKSMAALASLKVSVNPLPSHVLSPMLGHCGTDERVARREYDLLLLSVFASYFYDRRQLTAWYAPYRGDCHIAFFVAQLH